MGKLNIIIDGSWLFRACCADQILSSRTIYPSVRFKLDFNKMNNALLEYTRGYEIKCIELGERYIATSIFKIPMDIDDWPNHHNEVNREDVVRIKKNIHARNSFVSDAILAGYCRDAVMEPELKGYILKKILNKSYSEKQVDTTVVALTVKLSIINREDSLAIITGDADIIPAIKVAYPAYSENIFIVTTHPDELKAHYRQSAWSLTDFNFKIPPYYLQDHVASLMCGEIIYTCPNCHMVFTQTRPIPNKSRSYCKKCFELKQK